jgi:hypothetical protein
MAASKLLTYACLAGLLTTLSACADGTSGTNLAASAAAPAAAAEAAPAAPAPAAPKPAPQRLTSTEINERCWMSTEVNKITDLDKKAKLVDKCVADKMKAQQGM